MKKGMYEVNGIRLSKASPKVGEQLEITYFGLLATSGAQQVRIHFGYNETWENAEYIDMSVDSEGFKAVITLTQPGALNFAFLDPIGNWDNNSGMNYSVEVKAPRKAKKVSEGDAEGATAKVKRVSARKGNKADESEKASSAESGVTVKKTRKKAKSDETELSGDSANESKNAKSPSKSKAISEVPNEQKAKRGPGRPRKSA